MKHVSRQIRFGVICEGKSLLTWQKRTVQKLVAETFVELGLVIFSVNKNGSKVKLNASSCLWRLFKKHRIQKKSPALTPAKSDALFEDIPNLICSFKSTDEILFQKEHKAKIIDANLDFILDFSADNLSDSLFTLPKYGVWKYSFGAYEKEAKSTPCFWEIYQQNDVTSAYLIRKSENSALSYKLHEGHLKTSVSYRKNIEKMLHECTSWPQKLCLDIIHGKDENLEPVSTVKSSVYGTSPSNVQTLVFPLIQLKLRFKQVWRQLFFTDYWNIGIIESPITEFLNSEKDHKVNWFSKHTGDRFLADPFGMFYQDELHIIYEDLKFDQGIGKTARFLFEKGAFTQNEIVIDEAFHMSYPFLFEKDGQCYCIPETYQANQVRLYKAIDFPSKWRFEKNLIENYAGIDCTLIEYNDTWYMFSTDKNAGPHFNLNIHYASDVFGPWKAHPKNPVKTDIRSARSAGTIFEHDGELFRPSMDYSEKIEGRITINKVARLSTKDFKEEAYQLVQPFRNTYYSDKVHTLSKIGPYTLVDGAKELFILSNFKAFKYKIKRVLNKIKSN